MPVSAFLVYDGFDADLDTIIIYRRIKTLDNLVKPAIQALLNFLRGCMTSILINDTGTFIPSNVFIDSTPSASHTWGLNKFNINFPTLFSPHKEPGPTSDPPAASPDININSFQRFLSAALHNPSWKIFTPCAGRKSIFISSYAVWIQGTNHHFCHNCATWRANMSLRVFNPDHHKPVMIRSNQS